MHETGIIRALIREVERAAAQNHSSKVLGIRVRIGALSSFSDSHLLEHFQYQAKSTIAEHARLVIEHGTDPADPLAQDVALLSIEIEDTSPVTVQTETEVVGQP